MAVVNIEIIEWMTRDTHTYHKHQIVNQTYSQQ